MQRALFFCSLCLLSADVLAQSDTDPFEGMDGPRISLTEERVDLGDLSQGDKKSHLFELTNTGNRPLIINNVITTCGCTVPKWPEQPLAPGEKGLLKVTFDSSGKIGRQNKVITIQSNALAQYHRVYLSAMVLPPADGQ